MKHFRIFIMFALVMLFLTLSCACAEEDHRAFSVFRMPTALQVIEEGAFENTSPNVVYLPDKVEYIGDRAIAGTPLNAIFIPRSTIFIGKDAFADPSEMVIIGVPGSYAEDWARQHGYRFIYMDLWITDQTGHGQVWRLDSNRHWKSALPDGLEGMRWVFRFSSENSSTNPKDRPEMYPIEYDFP